MNGFKTSRLCGLAVSAAFLATACTRGPAEDFSPTEDSLYITGSGAVTSASIETYENDYYTEEELKASTEEYLALFNQNAGGTADPETPPAALNACTLADGTATLLLDFATPAAYLEFMAQYPDEDSAVQVKALSVGSVEETDLSGESFLAATGKEKGNAVSSDQVKKETRLHVVTVEGTALIKTDGEIRYVSDGVTLTGENGARTPDEGVSYIIFK